MGILCYCMTVPWLGTHYTHLWEIQCLFCSFLDLMAALMFHTWVSGIANMNRMQVEIPDRPSSMLPSSVIDYLNRINIKYLVTIHWGRPQKFCEFLYPPPPCLQPSTSQWHPLKKVDIGQSALSVAFIFALFYLILKQFLLQKYYNLCGNES